MKKLVHFYSVNLYSDFKLNQNQILIGSPWLYYKFLCRLLFSLSPFTVSVCEKWVVNINNHSSITVMAKKPSLFHIASVLSSVFGWRWEVQTNSWELHGPTAVLLQTPASPAHFLLWRASVAWLYDQCTCLAKEMHKLWLCVCTGEYTPCYENPLQCVC